MHAGNVPQQELCEVHYVRSNVAQRTAPGHRAVEAPIDGNVRVCQPVLQVDAPEGVRSAEATALQNLFGIEDRGRAPIVKAKHVRHGPSVDRVLHLHCFGDAHRHRFLAQDMLAGLGGCQDNLVMEMVGN